MISSIKRTLIKIIGYSNYRKVLTWFMRFLNGIGKGQICGKEIIDVRQYKVDGKDVFFGYYDLKSINQAGDKLLSVVIDGDTALVGYFDIATAEFHQISFTRAWNWQMGARLRWCKDGQAVLFNDYDDADFISREVDISGKEINRHPFPIFEIDEEKGRAYYTDFTILHHLREGYGYSNKNADFKTYYENNANGIFVGDMRTGAIDTLVTMEEIVGFKPDNRLDAQFHYVNHITVNPNNGDLMFFHLWTNDIRTWENRMIFLSGDGGLINVIDDFDRASHYVWKGNDQILVSIYVKGKVEYRLYNYRTGEYELMNGMTTDGHPSYIDDRYFITDTYPNRCAMQSLYVCDSKSHTYKNIFSIHHSTDKSGVYRCDLHPRLSGNLVNIDSVEGKYRCQYILATSIDCRNNDQWQRRLVLDKNAVVENDGPQHSNYFSCINSEYLYATGRSRSNFFKVAHMYVMGPVFRVNCYISWMQKTRNRFLKQLIHNHLAVKYSVDVSPTSKIGKHLRIDHFSGIVIGPGVVLGDFVKMYHQVTLGQKDGRFPVIGNYVTMYSGAKIIGGIHVGDYAVIGANAVVTKDVPEGAVVAGVPAKIIGYN